MAFNRSPHTDMNVTSPPKNTSFPAPQIPAADITTWTAVTLIISIIGCFNNILILHITRPRKGDKSGVNLLIFHFVIANFLNCLIHVPIRCFMVQAKLWGYPAPVSVCYFIQTFMSTNWWVVYWADASLAVNRCLALFTPHHYKAFSTKSKNIAQIAAMWLVSCALLLPYDLGIGGYLTVLAIGHCAYRGTNSTYGNFQNILKYAPFIIAAFCSIITLLKCHLLSRQQIDLGGHRHDEVIKRRIRSAKALVVSYSWSVVSVIPPSMIATLDSQLFERIPTANLWTQTAGYAQYSFAPIIILFANKNYQERLRKLLCHSWTRVKPHEPPTELQYPSVMASDSQAHHHPVKMTSVESNLVAKAVNADLTAHDC